VSEPMIADGDVLVAEPGTEAVAVGAEVVVVAGDRVHQLNAAAAAIWQSFVGPAPVGEVVADLAARFGVDPVAMRADVVGALAELRERGLVHAAGLGRTVSVPVLEPAPTCASCGPGPDFACHVLVAVADRLLSIGCDPPLVEPLVAAFGDRTAGVLDAPTGRPSYGLVLAEPGPGPIHPLHRLHRGPDLLVASRDPWEPVRALVTLVSRHLRTSAAYLDAVAVGTPTGVVLVRPPGTRAALVRAAAAGGLTLSEGASVAVTDPTTVRIGPDPRDDIDWSAVRPVLTGRAWGRPGPTCLPWGPVPVRAVAVHGPADPIGALSELGPVLVEEPGPLGPLRALAEQVPVVPVAGDAVPEPPGGWS
jgi:hypothetical protein